MRKVTITGAELARIERDTRATDKLEPRIEAVNFEPKTGHLHFRFKDGQILATPARELRGLAEATDVQLADVRPRENGASLHFDSLDVQFSTIALLKLIFKLPSQSDAARVAGATKSPAKTAAARINGAKGGRPGTKAIVGG